MIITQTETLVALVTQLGLSSTVPLDRSLHVTGRMMPGSSIYIEAGDYFKYGGLAKFIIKRTLPTEEPVALTLYRHANGERDEVFTTIVPADRLEQATFNNASSLSEIIVPQAGDIWELFVSAEATGIPLGCAYTLTLEP